MRTSAEHARPCAGAGWTGTGPGGPRRRWTPWRPPRSPTGRPGRPSVGGAAVRPGLVGRTLVGAVCLRSRPLPSPVCRREATVPPRSPAPAGQAPGPSNEWPGPNLRGAGRGSTTSRTVGICRATMRHRRECHAAWANRYRSAVGPGDPAPRSCRPVTAVRPGRPGRRRRWRGRRRPSAPVRRRRARELPDLEVRQDRGAQYGVDQRARRRGHRDGRAVETADGIWGKSTTPVTGPWPPDAARFPTAPGGSVTWVTSGVRTSVVSPVGLAVEHSADWDCHAGMAKKGHTRSTPASDPVVR